MTNNLSPEQVKKVADLAHIGLTKKEVENFKRQLSAILDFVSKLEEINTDKIEPLSKTTGLKNVFREDIIRPSFSQKEVLENAPEQHQGYFKVKAVF